MRAKASESQTKSGSSYFLLSNIKLLLGLKNIAFFFLNGRPFRRVKRSVRRNITRTLSSYIAFISLILF